MSKPINEARAQILASVRQSLKRGPLAPEDSDALAERLAAHRRNLVPARGQKAQPELVELFEAMAGAASATIERIDNPDLLPGAIADYLARFNLPAAVVAAPGLRDLAWQTRPTLAVRFGRAEGSDLAAVTPAFAAIAETGTLMLLSGPDHPTSLNFMPDVHLAVLHARDVVGPYEDGWDRLRAAYGDGFPRTVNFVTGPSRSGDIEQNIQLGAHGPRRLHILLVADEPPPAADGG